jgi:hypothetical protein
MLRHKALVQCARITFGMGDIVDPGEANRARQDSAEYSNEASEMYTPRGHQKAKRGPSSVNALRSTLGL